MTDAAANGADSWRGRRVLVTGGLGFIGSTLARRLAREGADVIALDCLLPGSGGTPFNLDADGAEPVAGSIRVVIADIRNVDALTPLIEDRDVVFNLAAQLSHMESMKDPLTDLDINARAVAGMLEICRQRAPACRITYASTRQVYGRPTYLPVDEGHPAVPVDVNGINKIAGESYHLLYSKVYGMATSVARLTNTYGPRMRIKDHRQTFLGVWVRAILDGIPFEVWGGDQLRDMTYVDDAVDALMRLALAPQAVGRIFNIGGDGVVSLKQLGNLLVEVSGGSFTIRAFPEERKAIDIGDFYADDRLIRDVTGWRPMVPLADGLRRTIDYYRRYGRAYL